MYIWAVVNKNILRLAIPNILSNISVPLLSTVDTALMGGLSAAHLGAIGLGAMIFNFVYWNFGFLRMGTTGLTAQAVGKHDIKEQLMVLYKALSIALALSVLFLIFANPLIELAIRLMNTVPDQIPMVRTYMSIRIWAAPATFGLYVWFGWFFGLQNAVIPLVITIVLNVINIFLSYFLVVRYGFEIKGVAFGTLIAQYVGLILAAFWAVYRYRAIFSQKIGLFSFYWQHWLSFFNINRDIFLRTLSLTLVFAFFYRASSSGGEMILAVNVILLQLLNWMSYGIDGFAFAAESLAGKYYGARDTHRMARVLKSIFLWSFGFAVLYSLGYGLFTAQLFGLFTNDASLISIALDYRWWIVSVPVLGFASYIWDGIFVGITAAKAMRNSMFLALVLFFGTYFITRQKLDTVTTLWLSLVVFLVARALLQWYLYSRRGWDLQ